MPACRLGLSRPVHPTLRRQIIEQAAGQAGRRDRETWTIEEFNIFYGATPKASVKEIQSPATWHLPLLDAHIKDNDDSLASCMLKWAFRVKPDLVVTDAATRALCIEAK
jgi:hypothetical protein